jgi:aspartate/methionine/tyrosine aminotransferase
MIEMRSSKLIVADYTAYNEMLSLFKNIAAIPVPLGEADQYHMSPDKIAEEIARGTSVILTSNPRNPTGQMVVNPEVCYSYYTVHS